MALFFAHQEVADSGVGLWAAPAWGLVDRARRSGRIGQTAEAGALMDKDYAEQLHRVLLLSVPPAVETRLRELGRPVSAPTR